MSARADRPRREWTGEQVTQLIVFSVVGVGMVIASAISYYHEYLLARHNGQVKWVSLLIPFSVDGMMLVAGVALLWAAMNGIKGWQRLWQPRAVLAVGVAATIAANFFSDLVIKWLGPAVSASSGLALVLMSAVAFWLLGEQRKLSHPEDVQPAADHTCPAPPTSLAEALPVARLRLRDDGEPFGEQALADRFGVTRHVVRSALAAPTVVTGVELPSRPPRSPSLNGHGDGAS